LTNKLASYLVGLGFQEILTSSITNSNYYSEAVMKHSVRMINSLTTELNVLRPSMLETALESIAYNINRKNSDLRFFEFGKTYVYEETGVYEEEEHLSLYLTGVNHVDEWRRKSHQSDFFEAKGVVASLLKICGCADMNYTQSPATDIGTVYDIKNGKSTLGKIVNVNSKHLKTFEIRQPVYFIDLNFEALLHFVSKKKIVYSELTRFQPVTRDLAIVVDKSLLFNSVENTIRKLNLTKLREVRLFDLFESEKLGINKKSIALNFTFIDELMTLTDKEIDGMMQQITNAIETQINGETRK
jgi:phenylalanyl-tRNA synthetase beta chain